jgi:hypothetical protein
LIAALLWGEGNTDGPDTAIFVVVAVVGVGGVAVVVVFLAVVIDMDRSTIACCDLIACVDRLTGICATFDDDNDGDDELGIADSGNPTSMIFLRNFG